MSMNNIDSNVQLANLIKNAHFHIKPTHLTKIDKEGFIDALDSNRNAELLTTIYVDYEWKNDATLSKLTFTPDNDTTPTEYYVSAKDTQISGDVVIPEYYKGLPVTKISEWGFNECVNITSVRIPDTVTEIGEFAFANCFPLSNGKRARLV